MIGVTITAIAVGITWLRDGINTAADALGRRQELNFQVPPRMRGGSVARPLSPGSSL